MPTYSIQGSTDPFVHVELAEGEKIMAERDAMAMMSDTIDLSGKARGGEDLCDPVGCEVLDTGSERNGVGHSRILFL